MSVITEWSNYDGKAHVTIVVIIWKIMLVLSSSTPSSLFSSENS